MSTAIKQRDLLRSNPTNVSDQSKPIIEVDPNEWFTCIHAHLLLKQLVKQKDLEKLRTHYQTIVLVVCFPCQIIFSSNQPYSGQP